MLHSGLHTKKTLYTFTLSFGIAAHVQQPHSSDKDNNKKTIQITRNCLHANNLFYISGVAITRKCVQNVYTMWHSLPLKIHPLTHFQPDYQVCMQKLA